MAIKSLVRMALGSTVVIGGVAWAARKFFASDQSRSVYTPSGGHDAGSAQMVADEALHREGLDPTLLEILACPDDKQPVIYQKEGDAERLTCTRCGKRYPVRDGIPVMLIDEAQPGPVPAAAEIAAARALAPQGKPALVGAVPSAPSAASPAPFDDAASATRDTRSSAG